MSRLSPRLVYNFIKNLNIKSMSKKSWYYYDGGDPLSATNYYKLGRVLPHNCLCGDTICMIYANDAGDVPFDPLSANMQQYITDALTTGLLQPQKPYNSKFFVYLRGEL